MDETIRWLLNSKDFQEYAAGLFQARGVPLTANPGHDFLVALREVDPRRFQALVQTPVAQLEQVRQHLSDNRVRAEKLGAALPAAKVAESWRALPEGHRLRKTAADPRVEAHAKASLARLGVPLPPGMSAGETWMAYVHAAAEHKVGDEVLSDMAALTGNALGDARQWRQVVNDHAGKQATDATVEGIGDVQRSRDAELKRQRALAVENPTYNPKRPPAAAITPKEKPRVDTRSTVAEIYDRTAKPPRVTVRNKRELDDRQRKNEYAPTERAEIDFAPEFKRELVEELRDDKFIQDEYGAGSPGGTNP